MNIKNTLIKVGYLTLTVAILIAASAFWSRVGSANSEGTVAPVAPAFVDAGFNPLIGGSSEIQKRDRHVCRF